VGTGAAAKTTSYTYWDPAHFGAGSQALVNTVTHPDGSWEYYASYDNSGRATQVFSAFGDAAVGDKVNGRETDYTFDPVAAGVSGTGDNGTLNIYTPRLVVSKVQGQVVWQSYRVFPSAAINYHVQCTTPSPTGWSDPHNLITTNLYYTSGPNQFELMAVRRPDGTLTTYNYFTNSCRTNITASGQPDPTDTYVVDGVSNVVVLNAAGYKVTDVSYDILSTLTLAYDNYGNYDSFGRPQQVTHLDGTTEYTQYACCGLESTTDRDGVNTVYLYDADRRSYGYQKYYSASGNPISYTNNLDGVGGITQTIRVGTDGTPIIQSQAAYDTAGRIILETNALNGVTTHVESIAGTGGLIRMTTNPDTGVRVENYYRDGSRKSVTGNAVHGKAYGYGVATDVNGNYCTYMAETNLDTGWNLTGEWTKTFTDMAGRTTEVLYSDGHYSQSIYNSLGQLVKSIDPDNVTTLYSYNSKGQQAIRAVAMTANETSISLGSDRAVTQTTNDVIYDHSTTVRRTRTFVWDVSGSTPDLASMTERSADGLFTWQTQYRDANAPITTFSQTTPGVNRVTTVKTRAV
jgi:hypothetical protein